jgi:peptidoglycan-associated lipoprotein
MKNTALTKLLVTTLAVTVVLATGCRSKRPDKNITPIPGVDMSSPEAGGAGNPIGDQGLAGGPGGVGDGLSGPGGPNFGGPGTGTVMPIELDPVPSISSGPATTDMSGYNIDAETGKIADTDAFAANTVYFDYDSSVVRSAEIVKLDEIIQILTSQPTYWLKIEGHCDERGTEEYNRSLGERRANSVRDHLMNAGVGPDRIRTISYGEDKPKDYGHDDGAWAQNRRAEFILLRPAQ